MNLTKFSLCAEKPYFKSKLSLETLGEIGKELEVACDMGGEPAPNVTWYRDAEPLGDIPAVRYTVLANNSLHIRYVTCYSSSY